MHLLTRTVGRGHFEDRAPKFAKLDRVCVRLREVVDAVVGTMASLVVDPLSRAVLLGIFVQQVHDLVVLADGNGRVTRIAHNVDRPLCIRTLGQKVPRQKFLQVDALLPRLGQN
jgi:hypothetical protein